MKILEEKKNKAISYKEFVRRSALESDYKTIITEDTCLVEGGKVKVIYFKVPGLTAQLVPHLKALRFDENTRTSGLKTISRIFGFTPRIVMRSDYCRTASLKGESPQANALVFELAKTVDALYHSMNPALYEKHYALSRKVKAGYRIPGTLFTSGIINKDNPLKYHHDAGNFRGVASVMVSARDNVTGGLLSLPEYGIALEIGNDSVTIFDGQDILHGVTPLTKSHRDGYRFTIVFYSLAKMWKCAELSEEIARARQVKLKRECKRAGITAPETLGAVR